MPIIATGSEIVETVRIAKMIETHGEQFLERVYTADEIEYCVQ
ncbi:ACP synthase, partial [Rhodopirellula sp. MGV]